jgi:hypothetical protein
MLPIDSKNKKIVIYTAITNNYETLQNPDVIDSRVKYICFTDQPLWLSLINDTVWQIKRIPNNSLDSTRKARQVKILSHVFLNEFNCDYSVWIDGNINIIGNIFELIDTYNDFKILGFKHYVRDCIYQEFDACLKDGKDNPEVMRKQIEKYRKEGFPEHYGLFETNVLIRKHSDANIKQLMTSWWHEVQEYSKRDQLSLTYVTWRENFHVHTMGNDNARGNSDFFCARPGWRTTPTNPKWQILWGKYFGWRLHHLLDKLHD